MNFGKNYFSWNEKYFYEMTRNIRIVLTLWALMSTIYFTVSLVCLYFLLIYDFNDSRTNDFNSFYYMIFSQFNFMLEIWHLTSTIYSLFLGCGPNSICTQGRNIQCPCPFRTRPCNSNLHLVHVNPHPNLLEATHDLPNVITRHLQGMALWSK